MGHQNVNHQGYNTKEKKKSKATRLEIRSKIRGAPRIIFWMGIAYFRDLHVLDKVSVPSTEFSLIFFHLTRDGMGKDLHFFCCLEQSPITSHQNQRGALKIFGGAFLLLLTCLIIMLKACALKVS